MPTDPSYEKSLPVKVKSLLEQLRQEGWCLVEVLEGSDWAHERSWLMESQTNGYGFQVMLDFYLYKGKHDGMDRVTVRSPDMNGPDEPYRGKPCIEFDGRNFSKQLSDFITSLDRVRCEGID